MRLALVMLAALLLAPLPVQAQHGPQPQGVRERVKEAEHLYQQGRYTEAAEFLERANQAMPDPRIVYNIARAYDQAGKAQEALRAYQQYVNSPAGTDPVLLKRAALSIDRLRVQLEREAVEREAREAERKRLQQEAQAAQARAEAEREATRRAEEAHRRQQQLEYESALTSHRRDKVLASAAGGLALASTGAGVLLGLQARRAREQFDVATTLDAKHAAASLTRKRALLADVGFGLGLASALGAFFLYPGEAPPEPGTVRLTVASLGAGAGMEVIF